jgi:hypothetical protein
VLLLWPLSGVLSLTLVLIVFFVIEGIASIRGRLDRRVCILSSNGVPGTGGFPPFLEVGSVAKPELGNKHQCQNCGARFFELNKSPMRAVDGGSSSGHTKTPAEAVEELWIIAVFSYRECPERANFHTAWVGGGGCVAKRRGTAPN